MKNIKISVIISGVAREVQHQLLLTPCVCVLIIALVAQLDRALGYEPRGQGFESLRARHFICTKSNGVLTTKNLLCYNLFAIRKVAQFGSARGLGP